jgi:hypothetical protein
LSERSGYTETLIARGYTSQLLFHNASIDRKALMGGQAGTTHKRLLVAVAIIYITFLLGEGGGGGGGKILERSFWARQEPDTWRIMQAATPNLAHVVCLPLLNGGGLIIVILGVELTALWWSPILPMHSCTADKGLAYQRTGVGVKRLQAKPQILNKGIVGAISSGGYYGRYPEMDTL